MWIARDKDGWLSIFEGMPVRVNNSYWVYNQARSNYVIDQRLFPEITWETEPQKIYIG